MTCLKSSSLTRLILWTFLSTLLWDVGAALKCMQRSGSYDAIVADDVCYWAYPSAVARSWTVARSLCGTGYGDLATVGSLNANARVAQMLVQPSFIGYYKNMAGAWVWANGDAVTYSQAFTDGLPVHMTVAAITGSWSPDFYDVSYLTKGFVCSTPMSNLQCPILSVANSIATTASPVRSSENVTYTCLPGYQMSGGVFGVTATCLSNRTWDVAVSNCTIITCNKYPLPSGMLRNTEAVTVGTNVTYTCSSSRAYFVPGPPAYGRTWLTSCLSDGTWSSTPPSCYEYTCSMPPVVQFASASSYDVYNGAALTYTCTTGYKFPESTNLVLVTTKTIVCAANQTSYSWSATTGSAMPNACIPITCQPLGLPANSIADTAGYTALTTVSVWCKVGYYFADISPTSIMLQSTCQTTSYWTKTFNKDCQPRTCALLNVNNATLITNVTDPVPLNTTLTYRCVGSLLFPGGNNTFVTTCTDTGEILPRPPLSGCQEGTCQSGWSQLGRYCYYASDAKRGQLRQNAADTSCRMKAGRLTDILTQEENDFVATLAGLMDFPPTGGSEYWTGWSFINDEWQWLSSGNVSNYTNWMVGYPDYPDAYFCSSITLLGQWKDKPCSQLLPYICKKLQVCGLPPTIENGGIATSPAPTYGEIGQSVTYSCKYGYFFSGLGTATTTITCKTGGFWSYIESCTTAKCAPVSRVTSATPSTTSNSIDTTVTYTCNVGFRFAENISSIATKCNSSLQWSRAVPSSCVAIQCPSSRSNATAYFGNNSQVGAMDRFTCLPGYIYPDGKITKQFTCSSQGIWLPDVNSTCQPVVCPAYSVANAELSIRGTAKYGQVVQVTCLTGYYIDETIGATGSANCTQYATWSQIMPPCRRKPCAKVPEVVNASCALVNDSTPLAYSSVNCTCLNDTVYISGATSMVITCHPVSLTWLGVPSRCVDEAIYLQSLNHTVVDAPNAVYFGSAGVVIVSIIVLGVIALDALTLKMHFGRRS